MKIDLSSADVFQENEIELDKKITFIFGKNGTGKSTLAQEISKLSSNYDISIFQGFANLIDENKRLNAVVLGEENAEISRKIEEKNAELNKLISEKDSINKTLQKPENDDESNYWTRRTYAENKCKDEEKIIDDFYSKAASKIKKMDNPRVALTSYNKRNFHEDINSAILLSEEDLYQNIALIKSEIKKAPNIDFPRIDFQKLKNDTNNILKKTVKERVKLNRLENNPGKRDFAQNGLKIHKKGDVCAFCGNKIQDTTWDELVGYFTADDVKFFRDEINNKINEIDSKLKQISELNVDVNNFYPTMINNAKNIQIEVENEQQKASVYLNKLRNALDEKLKFLFEECNNMEDDYSSNLEKLEKEYEELKEKNNADDLAQKKKEAIDRVRRHYVKIILDEFNYASHQGKLCTLKASENLRINEFNSEKSKIDGIGGLNEKIDSIQNEIITLQRKTISETQLADNINKKLKHMVSFELVHFQAEDSNGYYRVKDSVKDSIREITELSTGEKNIIAFLYFIEKLAEVKENPSNKPRIIVFDDPMSSNDDGMQYLIIEELQKLMNILTETDHFILMTHNKHFYLNVKYRHKYNVDRFIRFQSNGEKTCIQILKNENEDYKTSYESLWCELKTLFNIEAVDADLLLNPIRRIIETYTKFNAIDKVEFCRPVNGALKLFNVNSHSIDDTEAELNGNTKTQIIQMFYDCFSFNGREEHFKKFWKELKINENGIIDFEYLKG